MFALRDVNMQNRQQARRSRSSGVDTRQPHDYPFSSGLTMFLHLQRSLRNFSFQKGGGEEETSAEDRVPNVSAGEGHGDPCTGFGKT